MYLGPQPYFDLIIYDHHRNLTMAHYDLNGMKLKNVPIITYRDHVTYRENCHPHAFYLNFIPFIISWHKRSIGFYNDLR